MQADSQSVCVAAQSITLRGLSEAFFLHINVWGKLAEQQSWLSGSENHTHFTCCVLILLSHYLLALLVGLKS